MSHLLFMALKIIMKIYIIFYIHNHFLIAYGLDVSCSIDLSSV